MVPVLLIRPGNLRIGNVVLIESWSPFCYQACMLVVLTPIGTGLLLNRMGYLSKRGGASAVSIQLRLLAWFWSFVSTYFSFVIATEGRAIRPIDFLDIEGGMGIGHFGLLLPSLPRIGEIYNFLALMLLIEMMFGCYFLVLNIIAGWTYGKAAARA